MLLLCPAFVQGNFFQVIPCWRGAGGQGQQLREGKSRCCHCQGRGQVWGRDIILVIVVEPQRQQCSGERGAEGLQYNDCRKGGHVVFVVKGGDGEGGGTLLSLS